MGGFQERKQPVPESQGAKTLTSRIVRNTPSTGITGSTCEKRDQVNLEATTDSPLSSQNSTLVASIILHLDLRYIMP